MAICIYRNLTNPYNETHIPAIEEGSYYESVYTMEGAPPLSSFTPFREILVGKDMRYLPWFVASMKNPSPSTVSWNHYLAKNKKVLVTEGSMKRYDVNGTILGVSVVSFEMKNIHEFLSEFDEFEGVLFLWDIQSGLLIGNNVDALLIKNGTAIRIGPIESENVVIRSASKTLIQKYVSIENIPDISNPISFMVKGVRWLVTTKIVNLTEGTFQFHVVYVQEHSLIYGMIANATNMSIFLSVLGLVVCLFVLVIGSIVFVTLPLSKLVKEIKKVDTMSLNKINLGGLVMLPALFLSEIWLVRSRFKLMISKLKEYAKFLPHSLVHDSPEESNVDNSSSAQELQSNKSTRSAGSTHSGHSSIKSTSSKNSTTGQYRRNFFKRFNVGLAKEELVVFKLRLFDFQNPLERGKHDKFLMDFESIVNSVQSVIKRGTIVLLTFNKFVFAYNPISAISCLYEALTLRDELRKIVSNEIYQNKMHFKIIIERGMYYKGVVGNSKTKTQVFSEGDYQKERLLQSVFHLASPNEITLARGMYIERMDEAFIVELQDVLKMNDELYPLFLLKNFEDRKKNDEWLYELSKNHEMEAQISFRNGFGHLSRNEIDEAEKCFGKVNDGGKLEKRSDEGENPSKKLAVKMVQFCKKVREASMENILKSVDENKSIFKSDI